MYSFFHTLKICNDFQDVVRILINGVYDLFMILIRFSYDLLLRLDIHYIKIVLKCNYEVTRL